MVFTHQHGRHGGWRFLLAVRLYKHIVVGRRAIALVVGTRYGQRPDAVLAYQVARSAEADLVGVQVLSAEVRI